MGASSAILCFYEYFFYIYVKAAFAKTVKLQEIQFQREQARIQREQEIRKEQARIQKLKARGFQGGGVGKGTKALIYAPNHPPVYEY